MLTVMPHLKVCPEGDNLIKASGETSAPWWTRAHTQTMSFPSTPENQSHCQYQQKKEVRKKHFLTCQENVWIEPDPKGKLLTPHAPSYWNGCFFITDVL